MRRFKNGNVVVAPSSVGSEEPAIGKNGGIKLQSTRQTGCGIGESAPVPLHCCTVEKVQLARIFARDAAEIDIPCERS